MKRLILAASLSVPLLVAGAPTASATPSAGTYEVTACNAAPEGRNNSWSWSSTDLASPDHYAEHSSCPYTSGGTGGTTDQESGLSTTDMLGLSDGAGAATSAAWTFTAPEGTSISAITYERYLGHRQDSQNDWSPGLRADGAILPGQSCLDTLENAERCIIGGPPGHGTEPATITGLSAHQLAFGIDCLAPTGEECITGATLHAAWAAMYGATVTITDPNPPTLTTPHGELWEPAEYHHGTQTVQVSAADQGGGIKTIDLAADGQPIATYNASCDYTHPQPCPSSTGEQTLTLPTSHLPDGTHTLTLTATDAAGNQSAPISEQVTVVNNPPAAPLDLLANALAANSTTFTATWTNPGAQIAPITSATYQVCPLSNLGPCGEAISTSASGPATVQVPGAGTWDLAVWLNSAARSGSLSTAAHITLTAQALRANNALGPPISSPTPTVSGASAPAPSPPGPASVYVSATIHRTSIVVVVNGPPKGSVRIKLTARIKSWVVFTSNRRVALKHGHTIARIRVGRRISQTAQILIRVTVDGLTVTRRPERRR
jgi:hypothetical protein